MQQVNAPGVRWEWISEAWSLFTKRWSVWVLMLLVMFSVVLVAYLPMIILSAMISTSSPDDAMISILPTLSLLFLIIFMGAIILGMPWMFAGLYNAAFKQIRGEEISVRDLFSGGKYFLRILGAGLLIGIGVDIGIFLCIVPGLVFAGVTFLTYPMIIEGRKGVIDAIKSSIEVTKKDWIMFTVFAIALVIIAEAGAIACGVGILATLPLLFLSHALAYRDLVGIPGAQEGEFMPAPEYRSYTPSQTPYAPPDYGSYTQTPTPSAPPPPDYRPYTPTPTPSAPPPAPSWAAPTNVSPPASESETKTCPHCGATLARVVNFCNQCGRPLRSA
jgi:uncharacterized membrane protein